MMHVLTMAERFTMARKAGRRFPIHTDPSDSLHFPTLLPTEELDEIERDEPLPSGGDAE